MHRDARNTRGALPLPSALQWTCSYCDTRDPLLNCCVHRDSTFSAHVPHYRSRGPLYVQFENLWTCKAALCTHCNGRFNRRVSRQNQNASVSYSFYFLYGVVLVAWQHKTVPVTAWCRGMRTEKNASCESPELMSIQRKTPACLQAITAPR